MRIDTTFLRISETSVRLAGHSLTLAGAMVAVWTWCVVGWVLGFPPEWFLISNMFGTMATLFLLLGMQHSQNRDMHALQVKADELIRSSAARNELIGVERREAEELAELAVDQCRPGRVRVGS